MPQNIFGRGGLNNVACNYQAIIKRSRLGVALDGILEVILLKRAVCLAF